MGALAQEGSPGLRAAKLEHGVGYACALLHWVSSARLIHTSMESPRCLLWGLYWCQQPHVCCDPLVPTAHDLHGEEGAALPASECALECALLLR